MVSPVKTIIGGLIGSSLIKYIIRRILSAIPVLFGVILVTFLLVRAVKGGPFDFSGSKSAPPEIIAALNARYGLDKPLLLNLPSPETAKGYRMTYPALPDCDEVRAGASTSRSQIKPVVDIYDGWHVLRPFQERREITVTVAGKPRRCLQTTTVLYSDLTRSQFFEYLMNVLRLDFGLSLAKSTLGQPVSELIGDRFGISAKLGLLAVTLGFLLGIPLGVLAALYRNSVIDGSVTSGASVMGSVPTYVLGPLLIILFINNVKLLPSPTPIPWKNAGLFDWEFISRAILPVTVYGLGVAAGLSRLTRASLLQVLGDDYVRTARSKGLPERVVIYIHALKNALIPVITIAGPLVAGALTGSLIIERIFAIPGLGSVFLDGIAKRDYNLLIGVTILYAIFLIIGNTFVDIMYAWLDPRIRFD